jgi:hypothetical protein
VIQTKEKKYSYYLIQKYINNSEKGKISMDKPPNKMGNCPFASPLVTPLF